MYYLDAIREALEDPARLEALYRSAVKGGEEAAFRQAVETLYAEQPGHLLLAAWHYRLREEPTSAVPVAHARWHYALPLAVINGFLFWGLSDDRLQYRQVIPHFFLLWAPITAVFVLVYLYAVKRRSLWRLLVLVGGLGLVTGYVYLAEGWIFSSRFGNQYLTLGAIHLVLMAWAAVGLFVLANERDDASRFAFLLKSLEVAVLAGLFGIVLMMFSSITFGLLDALRLTPSELVIRLFFAGGSGLIPVLAVSILYDPGRPMRDQNFARGLSAFVTILLRMFIPLSVLVLLVYLGLIPFRFKEPFYNRDALLIYNVMLFAVVALLLGATPAPGVALTPARARWLRRGLNTLAALALLVSLYALAAIIFRTWWDGFTPNRITVIGWNVVNIGLLAVLLYRQARATEATWPLEMWRTFAQAALIYPVWGLILLVGLPLVF